MRRPDWRSIHKGMSSILPIPAITVILAIILPAPPSPPSPGTLWARRRCLLMAAIWDRRLDLAGLNNPTAVALDSKDNLYIAETNSNTLVRRVDADQQHHHRPTWASFRRQHGHFRETGGTQRALVPMQEISVLYMSDSGTTERELQRSRHHWRSATSRATWTAGFAGDGGPALLSPTQQAGGSHPR